MGACLQETSDYERLYSLDVLGVEDRGENDQLDVCVEFKENISRKADGRYEVNVPWIAGSQLTETNESQSRQRLRRVERKLEQDKHLHDEYEKIVEAQISDGIIESTRCTNRRPCILHASQASDQGDRDHHKGQNGIRRKRQTTLLGK